MTKHWPVQDAKARFSELLEASVTDGPQIITKRGVETAVFVSIEEWRKLDGKSGQTAKDLLLNDPRRFELDIPDRKSVVLRREPPVLIRCSFSTPMSFQSSAASNRTEQ